MLSLLFSSCHESLCSLPFSSTLVEWGNEILNVCNIQRVPHWEWYFRLKKDENNVFGFETTLSSYSSLSLFHCFKCYSFSFNMFKQKWTWVCTLYFQHLFTGKQWKNNSLSKSTTRKRVFSSLLQSHNVRVTRERESQKSNNERRSQFLEQTLRWKLVIVWHTLRVEWHIQRERKRDSLLLPPFPSLVTSLHTIISIPSKGSITSSVPTYVCIINKNTQLTLSLTKADENFLNKEMTLLFSSLALHTNEN